VAARNPKIKIVTTQWLFDCVSQWKQLDERPYRIVVANEMKQAERLASPPLEESGNLDLSSSEEDAENASLKIDTSVDGNGELEEQAGNASPADKVTDDQWSSMLAEIDEAESDTEDGDESDDSIESDNSTTSVKSTKKRKRDPGATDELTANADENDSDASTNGNGSLGSKLQQRKRRALERTSSLTAVPPLISPTTAIAPTKTAAATNEAKTHGNGEMKTSSPIAATEKVEKIPSAPPSETGSDDDGFAASLQAELEAQLNADDDDDGE
jgi:RNA polymerase II subunit A-like phosphatase